jgi:hypothetical protein
MHGSTNIKQVLKILRLSPHQQISSISMKEIVNFSEVSYYRLLYIGAVFMHVVLL